MSTVGAPNGNYVTLQAQWKRGQTQSSATQGDAPSQTFLPIGSKPNAAPAATTATTPASKPTTSVGTFPRFEPQTWQTLLALQSVGSGTGASGPK